MIAEEYNDEHKPKSSIPKGSAVSCIIDCFKITTPFFKAVLSQKDISGPINENKLTQIFVEQLKIQLRKKKLTFDVGSQYSDLFFNTKGIPDFYFHPLEEGKTNAPIFIVEAKRLPAPQIINEKEYVKGQKNNGGIERFKTGKHGKGLLECGIVGYIEKENSEFWFNKINSWVKFLAETESAWKIEELLTEVEVDQFYSYLNSIVITEKAKKIILHHFWIKTENGIIASPNFIS